MGFKSKSGGLWNSTEFHGSPRKRQTLGPGNFSVLILMVFYINYCHFFTRLLIKTKEKTLFFLGTGFLGGKNVPARNGGPAAHELLGVSGIPQNSMDPREKDKHWGQETFRVIF